MYAVIRRKHTGRLLLCELKDGLSKTYNDDAGDDRNSKDNVITGGGLLITKLTILFLR